MHIRTHTYIHAHMHTHIHTCTYAHTHIHTRTHIHTYTDKNRRMDAMGMHSLVYVHELPHVPHHTYMQIQTYIHRQACMRTYIDTNRSMDAMGIHTPVCVHELPHVSHHTYMPMQAYIYIHMHTYMQTYRHTCYGWSSSVSTASSAAELRDDPTSSALMRPGAMHSPLWSPPPFVRSLASALQARERHGIYGSGHGFSSASSPSRKAWKSGIATPWRNACRLCHGGGTDLRSAEVCSLRLLR
jgi:hypothetical protein